MKIDTLRLWGAIMTVLTYVILPLPDVAAAPQFVPTNGLPLDTPLGSARNADGSGVITFRTLHRDSERNAADIVALSAQTVSPGQLGGVLGAYLKVADAGSLYATPESVSALLNSETDRARKAEQGNADAIAALQAGTVTQDDVFSWLGTYLTVAAADARYATPAAVDASVASETVRAKAEEGANSSAVTAPEAVAATKTGLAAALASYLPVAGGATSGPLNGVSYRADLAGKSASDELITLTTDGSGALSEHNCFHPPGEAVTLLHLVVAGRSSNGADAVIQRFNNITMFTHGGTTELSQSGDGTTYPSFGNPGRWSVSPSLDIPTGCLRLSVRAAGSGSWLWRAAIHAEALYP